MPTSPAVAVAVAVAVAAAEFALLNEGNGGFAVAFTTTQRRRDDFRQS